MVADSPSCSLIYLEKMMDWSTYSQSQVKNIFVPLRREILECQADGACYIAEPAETKYFSLIEYITANYGNETLENWSKEADEGGPDTLAEPSTGTKAPLWSVAVMAFLTYQFLQIVAPRSFRRRK